MVARGRNLDIVSQVETLESFRPYAKTWNGPARPITWPSWSTASSKKATKTRPCLTWPWPRWPAFAKRAIRCLPCASLSCAVWAWLVISRNYTSVWSVRQNWNRWLITSIHPPAVCSAHVTVRASGVRSHWLCRPSRCYGLCRPSRGTRWRHCALSPRHTSI